MLHSNAITKHWTSELCTDWMDKGYERVWCSKSFRIFRIQFGFVLQIIIVNNSMACKIQNDRKKFMMLKNLWYKNGFAIEDLHSQWIFWHIYNLFVCYNIAVMWIGYDRKTARPKEYNLFLLFIGISVVAFGILAGGKHNDIGQIPQQHY